MWQGNYEALKGMQALLQQCIADCNPLAPDLERIVASYDKLLRRFDKVLSIGDSYQSQMMELKSRLEMMARTDLLTGLGSRWDVMERLQAEQSRSERHGKEFSILIADLDNFKKINDTHGHLAGDRLLKSVAATLRTCLRCEDICGRWGGEEFLIVLPETGLQEAHQVARKLLEGVRRHQVPWEGSHIGVTMSIGVGVFKPGMSIDGCIKLVDEALCTAKNRGRDRIVAAAD
ncbi:hypothetical protein GSbR_16390 [Geobacter sp. SVR]|nr:hypothetical protein GSbR_16390 [Geobacter sp. SVR]